MDISTIRNFSIIAHIDHGKSTLADRMLEITHTVETRKMREQVLDSMELERERGITIKMQPVRMNYEHDGTNYTLNLIDTPGHIDFYYEVSRALKAVEGSILLVDCTQGVQAQTLTTLGMAQSLGLRVIPVLSKIDSPQARIEEVRKELAELVQCDESEILEVSGKTGQGVELLLQEVIKRIPPPKQDFIDTKSNRSLIFDFQYSDHRGVIVYIRMFDGVIRKGDELKFAIADRVFKAIEVGVFAPQELSTDFIGAGQIGYIVTGIKEPGVASVGDTITTARFPLPALAGYQTPLPVVWASLYPESQDDLHPLRLALSRLRLSDSSFSYEEESSGTLGRGFRCGFLGMLHLEIITERLRREFNMDLIVTTPSITYEVTTRDGKMEIIYSPVFFPEDSTIESVREPWVSMKIITPPDYVGALLQLLYDHEAEIGETTNFGEHRTTIATRMPLREMMRNFFDEIKSVTSGYASISYEIGEMKNADVVRMDLLVADEIIPAFTRVVSRRRVEEEAEKAVKKLHTILPRQMFTTKIQAKVMGRIISSETLSGMKKDVTQHMYGGDITRKMKLREKQKKGKKKMKDIGTVNIPQEVFVKMMRGGNE